MLRDVPVVVQNGSVATGMYLQDGIAAVSASFISVIERNLGFAIMVSRTLVFVCLIAFYPDPARPYNVAE